MADKSVEPGVSELHHGLRAHESVLIMQSDRVRGLARSEARARLERYGPNELARADSTGWSMRFLHQLNHPLIYILLASGAVALLLGEYVDATVILLVVLVNALVGLVQESRAEATLDALRAMVTTKARVVRDGWPVVLPSRDIVPGDLVVIEAGDRVPADIRLVTASRLAVDESTLTGESLPVAKDEVVLPLDTPVADRRNMLYSGTLVTVGSGSGVAVATGSTTELGEIHRLVGSARPTETPLTRKLARFSGALTVTILGLAAVTFVVGLVRGKDPAEMVTAAVALAVGAIPEGLPAAVTITLAIGVGRMARRRAVVRRLPAVETLGSTTVICTDKTGTLTRNQMTVTAVWTAAGRYDVSGSGYDTLGTLTDACGRTPDPRADEALHASLRAGVCCSDAHLADEPAGQSGGIVGDPTEGAMLVVAEKAGVGVDGTRAEAPRICTKPFSSEARLMETLHRVAPDASGPLVAYVKGAVEDVLRRCTHVLGPDGALAPLDAAAATAVTGVAEGMASEGLRVIATAVGRPRTAPVFEAGRVAYAFAGLQAMLDPPRPDVARAVRSCREAGIGVKMITGDHAVTAHAIARRIGLLPDDGAPGDVLTGSDLAALAPEEYDTRVNGTAVFARVTPEQKLHLVTALQRCGHVVAMTGDGVNDAPALRQADIGIAMGLGGTEVAKDAADMVLLDDDFTTIEAAVDEGRGVFDNLIKFIVWTLPTNMGEGLVILFAILLGTALPINPVQVLWINMTTAVLLGLALAFEPKESGIMARPPRDPSLPIFTRPLVARILLVSAVLVLTSRWLFTWEQEAGATLAEARTAAVNMFVAVETVYLFHCRSLSGTMRDVGIFSNRWIWIGVAMQWLFQIALTYVPAMNSLFGTAPVDAATWLRILVGCLVAGTVMIVDKHLRRWSW